MINPPDQPQPRAEAKARLVKQLPPTTDNLSLYHLFRPFGPLAAVRCIETNLAGEHTGFRGMAQIDFYLEQHALAAQNALHCETIGRKTISVSIMPPGREALSKKSTLSVKAQPFTPAALAQKQQSKGEDTHEPAGTVKRVASGSAASIYAAPQASVAPAPAADSKLSPRPDLSIDNTTKQLDEPARSADWTSTSQQKPGSTAREPVGSSKSRWATSLDGGPAVSQGPQPTPVSDSKMPQLSPRHPGPAVDPTKLSPQTEETPSDSSPVALASKERSRLYEAVKRASPHLKSSAVDDVTDLLCGLPKKERASCLFNPTYLQTKVEEAKEALDLTDNESCPPPSKLSNDTADDSGMSHGATDSADYPREASISPSTSFHTLASLAHMSCKDIITLVEEAQHDKDSSRLPLPKIEADMWTETDRKLDTILQEPKEVDRKQKLGQLLFKQFKASGVVKGGSVAKITIALLDQEDLRSLGHVMDSFPELLKEKIAMLQKS